MTSLIIHSILIAFAINFIFYLIAYYKQTDKLTDLTYSLTFIAISAWGFTNSERGLNQILVLVFITIWAIRLGSFLMRRVHHLGKDDRFDNLRPYPIKFLGFWTMQALTCVIVSLPAIIIYTFDNINHAPFSFIGYTIAVIGLLIETIADHQKFHFKSKNPTQFMQSGLWRRIRHPNYLGEILFWVGISLSALIFPYGWIGLLAPIWISFILIRFSGIPLLKEKWKKRYGDQQAFKKYLSKSWNLVPYIY